MNITKITVISIVTIFIISLATALIINIKPQMHKRIKLENIIFVRSK